MVRVKISGRVRVRIRVGKPLSRLDGGVWAEVRVRAKVKISLTLTLTLTVTVTLTLALALPLTICPPTNLQAAAIMLYTKV